MKKKRNEDLFELRVQKLYKECLEELAELKITPGKELKGVEINRRARKRLGCCKKTGTKYTIEVSSMLESEKDKTIKEVLLHELLHTCRGCMNHGREWKRRAQIINNATDYKITTTANGIMKMKEDETSSAYKYLIKCQSCEFGTYRVRKSKVVKNPKKYRCPKCGGNLKIYEL